MQSYMYSNILIITYYLVLHLYTVDTRLYTDCTSVALYMYSTTTLIYIYDIYL